MPSISFGFNSYSFYNPMVSRERLPNPEVTLDEMGLEGDTKLWIGKDYTNFIAKDFVDLDKPFTGTLLLSSKRQIRTSVLFLSLIISSSLKTCCFYNISHNLLQTSLIER